MLFGYNGRSSDRPQTRGDETHELDARDECSARGAAGWSAADRHCRSLTAGLFAKKPTTEKCDSNDPTQKWIVSSFGGEWLRIENRALGTRRCLDDSPNGLTLVSSCWPGDDARSAYQKWDSSGFGNGYIRLQNQWSRYCLDDSFDKGLRTNHPCATASSPIPSQKYQSWR